jgi:tRNA threonylcarbamoyladenosine modification (KEOPS) complex Cgi121 subunit
MEVKKDKRVFIQFLNPSCLVSELVPFLIYNVHQAFKYGYNLLRGFEQELLVALYGKRSFQEASSIVGVSVSNKAAILVISEEVTELKGAIDALKESFSEKGYSLKPFNADRELFKSFWNLLLSKDPGVKVAELGFSEILDLVKERVAIGYCLNS